MAQLVPKVFEADGRAGVAFTPENGNHLTERADASAVFSRQAENIGYDLFKLLVIRPIPDHKLIENSFGVVDEVLRT